MGGQMCICFAVLATTTAPFDLAADGLVVLPKALDTTQLAGLNLLVDVQLGRLAITDLAKFKQHGSCFADIIQRGPGKYELKIPDLIASLPTKVMARWWPIITNALGADAELRSVTVILSVATTLDTAEPAVSQHWHSDGSLPPDWFALPAYALVVYIPLRSVPPDGGRVEYLLQTHTNRSLRVGRNDLPWSATWGTDMVTPEMDAGDAVVYSYTTQHRGLRSKVPGYRPVLKLDYFMPGVGTRKIKDGWCEENGFLLQ